jgi:hypothetical protein
MNEKLSALVEEVRRMSDNLKAVKRENDKLKETVAQQADEIAELRNEVNDRELHARSWSIRINNLPVPQGQETSNKEVMSTVYNELVAPILAGAKEKGDIADIPNCDSLIEIAHILPGKGSKKPVIVRFHSRYWRSLLFKHRKDSAPREAAPGDRPGRMKYPFYEDLTRATFKQLKAIQSDERVSAAWTVSGTIRFKLENDERVHRVSTIYDTIDDILE